MVCLCVYEWILPCYLQIHDVFLCLDIEKAHGRTLPTLGLLKEFIESVPC